jgi:hypothetical protein
VEKRKNLTIAYAVNWTLVIQPLQISIYTDWGNHISLWNTNVITYGIAPVTLGSCKFPTTMKMEDKNGSTTSLQGVITQKTAT